MPIVGGILIDNWLPYSLISHHNRSVASQPDRFEEYGLSPQQITYTSESDISIRGWFIPGDADAAHGKKTVIILHGLGATRQDMLEFGLLFQQKGYNLALIDLRSHGESGGAFFTYGYHEWKDVVGLLDWLDTHQPMAVEDVTLIGVSVGGAVAIPAAANDDRIDRLITIATFADLEETIQAQSAWLPNAWRNRGINRAESLAKFDVALTSPAQTIQQVDVPVLIVHGEADGYIPFENGQQLYAAANPPKTLYSIPGADHADVLYYDTAGLHEAILTFDSIYQLPE